jgi:branched-chain amino acid transport system substrate-binding protein
VQGPFRYGARLYARYALGKNPGAKFAVLSQNDDFGRDYLPELNAAATPRFLLPSSWPGQAPA